MSELEEGGMFDEDTMPDWMRTMRGVAHRSSLPPPGPQPGSHHQADPAAAPLQLAGLPPPGQPGLPAHLSGPELGGLHGLPPPFLQAGPGAGPGLLPHPPGLQLGQPGQLILRPGFPASLAPAGPPPGFPGFDSSQPPPGLPGVLGGPALLPRGPPGLLGPPPGLAPAPQQPGLDLPPNVEVSPGGRGGREPRGGERRERPGRRESRWGRAEEEREQGGAGGESVASRLQSMAGMEGGPVSLLDLPDIPKSESRPDQNSGEYSTLFSCIILVVREI